MVYERIIQLFFHLPSHNNLYCTVQFVFPQEFPAYLQLLGGCGLFYATYAYKTFLQETSPKKVSDGNVNRQRVPAGNVNSQNDRQSVSAGNVNNQND